MEPIQQTLGLITAMRVFRHEGELYTHASYGRIVDEIAKRYSHIVLSAPIVEGEPDSSSDHCLQADNIEIVAQPPYRRSKEALLKMPGIIRSYWRVMRRSDVAFVREVLPGIGVLLLLSWFFRCKVTVWVIGDPIALLKSHRRTGWLGDKIAMAFAIHGQIAAKLGRRLTGGAFMCNGAELGEVFRSPRTVVTVSTTVTDDEFYHRDDTCQGDTVKILLISFIRPEKGVEYLLEGVAKLPTSRKWELHLVGPTDQHTSYKRKLDSIIEANGIGEQVVWDGYAKYGPEIFQHLRESDLFVLPTLSEGTPRVLVEARANSLPIVATNVGGIPTSVRDEHDGLLVPPKDSAALCRAIGRIIEDGDLRRRLMRNGMESARNMTVEKFVDLTVSTLDGSAWSDGNR